MAKFGLTFTFIDSNHICCGQKDLSSKSATKVYATRYLQGEEEETVEHKLKILILALELIINKLTNWKNFVLPTRFCPSGQLGMPAHKQHMPKKNRQELFCPLPK